ITLDFRGLIFWTYIALLAIDVALSSIGIVSFPKSGVLRIHFCSMVLSVILLVVGFILREAGAGIEPANSGFADRDLTTWLPRHGPAERNYRVARCGVNLTARRSPVCGLRFSSHLDKLK